MMRLAALLLGLMLVAGAAEAQSFQGRTLIVTDGRAANEAAPLVLMLHGLTGTGRIMQRKTTFDMLARAHGFVVAYPNGTGRRWQHRGDEADVAYLSALIGTLTATYGTDPQRVFLVGYSNGGAMALRMACENSARLRGIAVVAMTQPRNFSCADDRPVATVFIHGGVDPVVPPTGLDATSRFEGLLPIDETLAHWTDRNRCTARGNVQEFDQTDGADTAQITQYTGCRRPLTSVLLTGQGHDWPGAAPRLTWLLGPASRELDAAAFSWRFFAAL